MDPVLVLVVLALSVALTVGLVVLSRRSDADVEDGVAAPVRGLGAALRRAWGTGDESIWPRLTETLIAADVGVAVSERLVSAVRQGRPESFEEARSLLAETIRKEMASGNRQLTLAGDPAVILVVGVNGNGKTTTIAKLARRLAGEGQGVLLAAADTFRAAAGEQLRVWGEKVGAPVVVGQQGGDPGSVVYDALASARARGADVLLVDTAGRLHSKKDLMAELEKVYRVAGGDQVDEVLLVIDAPSGQNALVQSREFVEAVPVTGIVLTKLDGTAKGGIVVAVESELGIPVKFVGTGEGFEHLEVFDPDHFLHALLED